MVSLFRTVIVKPVAGIGDVGIKTLSTGSLAAELMSSMLSPVTKPIDHIPLRGYSTATTRLNCTVKPRLPDMALKLNAALFSEPTF